MTMVLGCGDGSSFLSLPRGANCFAVNEKRESEMSQWTKQDKLLLERGVYSQNRLIR